MTRRRRYTAQFKAQVVLEIISGAKSQAELARWRRHFLENAPQLFEQEGNHDHEAEVRLAELEQALGRKTLELEVAKKASSIFRRLSGE
jgi:transposase-like protein